MAKKSSRKSKQPDEGTEKQRELLEQLKAIGERVGVEVREEKLVREVGYSVRSGRCVLDGKDIILLDRNAGVVERTEVLIDALSHFDLTGVYMEPELRRLIGDPGEASLEQEQSEPAGGV